MDVQSSLFPKVIHDLSIVRPWVLRSALKIGVINFIDKNRKKKRDIAIALDADEIVCDKVIDYLAAIGYISIDHDGVVMLTELGQALVNLPNDIYSSTSPMTVFDRAAAELYSAWKHGAPVVSRREKPYWQEVAEDAQACLTLARYQPRSVQFDGNQLVSAILAELSATRSVLDLGGSNGALIRDLSVSHKGRMGLLDLPAMIKNAREVLTDLQETVVTFHGGSFFDYVPKNYDVYVLNAILYDYADEQVQSLFLNIHDSIPEGSVFIVSEIISMFSDAYTQAESSLMLTLNTGGRLRTMREVVAMGSTAGFLGPREIYKSEQRYTVVFDR